MLRPLPMRQSIVLLLIAAVVAVSTSCGRDHDERPRSAREASEVLNRLDVTATESLKLANVFVTRYLPVFESAAQDSVWMTYSAFIARFIAAQEGKISQELLVDGNGPLSAEGIISRTDGDRWWLEPDRQWQYDRFAARSDSSLHEWLRIRQSMVDPGLGGSFRTIHRLEYWADHYPDSPMLAYMQREYRSAITDVLNSLDSGFDPWRSDYRSMFDQLHLYAGLDAVRTVTQYILSQQRGAADLNPNAFTDTLRYRPRSWIVASE